MSGCAEVRRRLQAFLALELVENEERQVRAHLRECTSCQEVAAEREPALFFASALAAAGPAVEDEGFVPAVMAAVHQRRLETRLKARRRRWLAAAVVAGVLLAGVGALRHGEFRPSVVGQRVDSPASAYPPLPVVEVEVEGEDVRLYQLAGSASGEVQVAFIIDPGLEL